MPDKVPGATVYHDGSCPLCAIEIQHYRNLDSDKKLDFVDVSATDAVLPENLTRQQAMARFHVMTDGGRLMSGARAFAEVWANLPKWRWAARLAGIPGVMHVLEAGYSVSLLGRPTLAALVSRIKSQAPSGQHRNRKSLH